MLNSVAERLFFALWPTESVRLDLSQLSQVVTQTKGMVGKIISPPNWHITLAFLGDINVATKPCLEQAAATIKGQRFNLFLDQLGYWPNKRILWLGTSQTPATLAQFVTQLATAL